MSGPPAELVFQELAGFVFGAARHCADCSRVESPISGTAPDDVAPPLFDVVVTLDGGIIATEAFRVACAGLAGLQFIPLAGLADHWLVDVDRTVQIDPFESHVRRGPTCATCGRPRYVTRSGPLRLDENEVLLPGFSRTDIEFGDTGDFGAGQPVRLRALILVDRETAKFLKSSGLSGIHLITQP